MLGSTCQSLPLFIQSDQTQAVHRSSIPGLHETLQHVGETVSAETSRLQGTKQPAQLPPTQPRTARTSKSVLGINYEYNKALTLDPSPLPPPPSRYPSTRRIRITLAMLPYNTKKKVNTSVTVLWSKCEHIVNHRGSLDLGGNLHSRHSAATVLQDPHISFQRQATRHQRVVPLLVEDDVLCTVF
jgi:hypothetical protein